MNKLLTKILLGFFAVFLFTGTSFAATSVRLQQPVSPTNQNSFNITFVALDTENSSVSVQCFKKSPSDGSFTAFGSAINLSAGGNTDVCQVDSGIISANGAYQFQVTAAGSGSVTSNTVSVDYNNSTPGTPVSFSKNNLDGCNYKIDFRTAPDSGKTTKVVLYRSLNSNFDINSGSQVDSVNIGSDTDGSFNNHVPDCTKTYYFAIRAFDIYGNGSGVVGDSSTVTSTTTTTTASPTTAGQGAISVGGAGGGQVLGEGTAAAEKGVLGEATKSAEKKVSPTPKANPVIASVNWIFTHKKISLSIVVLVLIGVGFYLYRRFSKRVK